MGRQTTNDGLELREAPRVGGHGSGSIAADISEPFVTPVRDARSSHPFVAPVRCSPPYRCHLTRRVHSQQAQFRDLEGCVSGLPRVGRRTDPAAPHALPRCCVAIPFVCPVRRGDFWGVTLKKSTAERTPSTWRQARGILSEPMDCVDTIGLGELGTKTLKPNGLLPPTIGDP